MRRRIAFVMFLALRMAAAQDIVREVRAAIAKGDFERGDALVRNQPITPERAEAISWLGRGALAAKQYDRADSYAVEARKLALAQLAKRKLDAETHLPLALGASIETQAFIMDAHGERGEAVQVLRREL